VFISVHLWLLWLYVLSRWPRVRHPIECAGQILTLLDVHEQLRAVEVRRHIAISKVSIMRRVPYTPERRLGHERPSAQPCCDVVVRRRRTCIAQRHLGLRRIE
jgi:hypothetical protein